MLPADHRMRRSDEFRRVVRHGRRAGSRTLVIHLLDPDTTATEPTPAAAERESRALTETLPPNRVGFVVGRGVGGSVVRSQVTRRLRHLMRSRLDALPAGALVVVRAQAPAASASSAMLAGELDRALARLASAEAA